MLVLKMMMQDSVAQQPYNFCCFQQTVYDSASLVPFNWTDTSFRVQLDLLQKRIRLHNKEGIVLRITANKPLQPMPDGNAMVFDATDNKGDTCKVQFIAYIDPDFHMGTLILAYANRQQAYRLHQCSQKRVPNSPTNRF